jgi:3-phosphoshikimate 1-carboxyvinyltransferase
VDAQAHATDIAALAAALDIRFEGERIVLEGCDCTDLVRQEASGGLASQVSALPSVRTALHARQLAFRQVPGLVADGRDMGTVVFPEARLKIFLTADAATRAERRGKQLIAKGFPANIDSLRQELEERDARDRTRSVAPLKPAEDAVLFDNSTTSIEASVGTVVQWWEARSGFATP